MIVGILLEYLPNKIRLFLVIFFFFFVFICVALIYLELNSMAFYCRSNWNFIEKVSPLNIKNVTAMGIHVANIHTHTQ